MNTPSDNWAAEALERALDDLPVARAEYESAVIRLHKVEEAIKSLQALVGDDEEEPFEIDPTLAAERNRIVHGGLTVQPPKRKQSFHSSTMRVLRVILGAHRPISSEEIVAAFRKDRWPETDGAIQQAARRCQGYGFVWRDKEKNYAITRLGREALEKAEREEYAEVRREALAENGEL